MNVQPKTPLTVVKLLSGVPIDNTYTDQLDFSSASAQSSFFDGYTKYTFNNMTPVRMQDTIRIPKPADDVYNCNYVMFQNANFNNKWFYAFINAIDFINVNECQIHIDLDVWQTWQFDIIIHNSFVERQHVADDTIGGHTVPEALDYGNETFVNVARSMGTLDKHNVGLFFTTKDTGVVTTSGFYDGVFQGCGYVVYPSDDVDALVSGIKGITSDYAQPDNIVALVQLPDTSDFTAPTTPESRTHYKDITFPPNTDTLNGWKPVNNRLYCYPYNYLEVSNTQGEKAILRYEHFNEKFDTCEFRAFLTVSPSPQLIVAPKNYEGVGFPSTTELTGGNPANCNFDYAVTINNYPQCSFNIDTYKAWLAQNGSANALSIFGSLAGGLVSAATGNVGGMLGAAGSIASTINSQVTAERTLGNKNVGSTSGSVMYGCGAMDIVFKQVSVTYEYARIIDNYFTMYGYAINRLKAVNYKTRPYWNYIKTIDVKITGAVPFGDMARIKQMFNDGVTFWHDGDVGNYNRDNSPI